MGATTARRHGRLATMLVVGALLVGSGVVATSTAGAANVPSPEIALACEGADAASQQLLDALAPAGVPTPVVLSAGFAAAVDAAPPVEENASFPAQVEWSFALSADLVARLQEIGVTVLPAVVQPELAVGGAFAGVQPAVADPVSEVLDLAAVPVDRTVEGTIAATITAGPSPGTGVLELVAVHVDLDIDPAVGDPARLALRCEPSGSAALFELPVGLPIIDSCDNVFACPAPTTPTTPTIPIVTGCTTAYDGMIECAAQPAVPVPIDPRLAG